MNESEPESEPDETKDTRMATPMRLPKLNRAERRKLLYDARTRNEVAKAKKAFAKTEARKAESDAKLNEALKDG